MARHQRPRRLRVGHRVRGADAPLSRAADRRAADPVRPHGDAQLRRRAAALPPTAAWCRWRRRSRRPMAANSTAPATSPAFRLEAGLPVWTYEVDGVRFEKRVLMPHLQNTTHVTYRLLSNVPVQPRAAAVLRLPAARSAGEPSGHRAVRAAMPTAIASRSTPGGDLPPLRLFLYGEEKAFTDSAGGTRRPSPTRSSRIAATSAAATCGRPATSA